MKTKICSKCKIKKPLSEFHKSNQTKDGYKVYCKKCRSIKSNQTIKRETLAKNCKKLCPKCNKIKNFSEFNKETKRKYGIGVYCKECIYIIAKENKDRINNYYKKWAKNNKDKIKISNAKQRNKNKQYYKEYYKNNKEEHLKKCKIYSKNRRIKDIGFKILLNLRRRLAYAINGKDKSKKTTELLGCSIQQLKKYLESKFKSGMSWDNYGRGINGKGMQEWHIDHIIPCASFDLSKPEEQRKCFHYSNLQPLWAKENLEKSNK